MTGQIRTTSNPSGKITALVMQETRLNGRADAMSHTGGDGPSLFSTELLPALKSAGLLVQSFLQEEI